MPLPLLVRLGPKLDKQAHNTELVLVRSKRKCGAVPCFAASAFRNVHHHVHVRPLAGDVQGLDAVGVVVLYEVDHGIRQVLAASVAHLQLSISTLSYRFNYLSYIEML
jgi:hypothetical protein